MNRSRRENYPCGCNSVVECLLAKQNVAGSNPAIRSKTNADVITWIKVAKAAEMVQTHHLSRKRLEKNLINSSRLFSCHSSKVELLFAEQRMRVRFPLTAPDDCT